MAPAPALPEIDLNDPQNTQDLLNFWAEGITTMEIANRLGASKKAIEQRIAKMRRGSNHAEKEALEEATEKRNKQRGVDEHKWTQDMVDFLLECKGKGMGNKEIGLLMNKTAKAVERKAYKLLRPHGPRTPSGKLIQPNPDDDESRARDARVQQITETIAELQNQQERLLEEEKTIRQMMEGNAPAAPDPVQQLSELQQTLAGLASPDGKPSGPSEEQKEEWTKQLLENEIKSENLKKEVADLSQELERLQEEIKQRAEQLAAHNGIPPRKRKRNDSTGGSARKRTKKDEGMEDFAGTAEMALYDGTSVDVASILSAAADIQNDIQVPVLGPVLGEAPVTPTRGIVGSRPGSLGRGRGKKNSRDDEDDFRPDMAEYAPPSVPTRQSSRRVRQTRSYAALDASESEDDDDDAVLEEDEEDDEDDEMDLDDEENPRRRSAGLRGARGGLRGRGAFRGRGGRGGARGGAVAASTGAAAGAGESTDPAVLMNRLAEVAAGTAPVDSENAPAEATEASGAQDPAADAPAPVAPADTANSAAPAASSTGDELPPTTDGPFKLL